MSVVKRRVCLAIAFVLTASAPVALGAQAAAAFPATDSVIAFDYNIVATSHIQKANQTLTIGGGKFKGEVDFDTAKLEGSISLPPVTFTFQQSGVGLVTATAAMVQTKKVTGTVNLNNFKVTATSTFNIRLLSMYADPKLPTLPILPLPLPPLPIPKVNLVGKNCITSSPISVTMSGIAKIGAKSTFKGTYSIPPFKNCALATAALNQLIPGGGNTFSATAQP